MKKHVGTPKVDVVKMPNGSLKMTCEKCGHLVWFRGFHVSKKDPVILMEFKCLVCHPKGESIYIPLFAKGEWADFRYLVTKTNELVKKMGTRK